ncbi:MAG TPA: FtsQ-type POTRA domain-containing protein [Bacteroidota bacterium]|nr:FtsQ-type POTRA domain-containing protein [Bacteroidota bacterium]
MEIRRSVHRASQGGRIALKPAETAGRTGWILALTAVLLIGIVTVAVTANRWKRDFRIQRIRTEGNAIVADSDIVRLAAIPRNGKLFDIDLNGVRQKVQQNPFMKRVSVVPEIPDGIAITVVERKPVAAIVTERILYLDEEGYVLPPVRSAGVLDLPVLTGDLPAADCQPGRQIRSRRLREALEILTVAERIGDGLQHMISEVHCQGDSTYVLFTAESGIPVLLGRGDVALKLVTLDGFWKQIVMQRGAAELKTVDLRFADQVVVRWNGAHDGAAQ